MSDASSIRVSVVVPCFNEQATIVETVSAIERQRDAGGRAFAEWGELIVVDDASRDRTPTLLETFASGKAFVQVLRNEPNRGIAASLNRGIAASRAPLLLACHGDCRVLGEDYVDRMLRHFDDAGVAAVTGKPATPDFAAISFTEQLFILMHLMDVDPEPATVREINFVEGRCDGLRKAALLELGGYDERTKLSGEDQVLAIKLTSRGYRLLSDTSLVYRLGAGGSQNTPTKMVRRQAVYAAGQAFIFLRYGLRTALTASSVPNRARRRQLRAAQVVGVPLLVAAGIATAVVSIKAAAVLVGAAIGLRFVYHLHLCGNRFPAAPCLAMFPWAIAGDVAYAMGFVGGVWRTWVRDKV
ncbi:MAG TPA: glycosyltransferase family 2 protein [Tepidisphaeraceae bacterium]